MRYLIAILSLAGVLVSALALQVHYSTATEPCSINEHWDCGIVNHSSYSVIFGVPVAAIGIAGYLALGVLALARRRILLLVAALLGLGFALHLSDIERNVLSVWCLYCVISQGIIALLSLLSLAWLVVNERSKRRVRTQHVHSFSRRSLRRLVLARDSLAARILALIKLKQIHVERLVRALDVRMGDAADHARRKSRGAPAGVGLRVDRALSRGARLWRRGSHPGVERDEQQAEAAMVRINQLLIRHSSVFFGYKRPTDFRLEERHPQLYPTNVRPETLAKDAALKQQAAEGKLPPAQFLRFTSPERTPYPENDLANARWYPAPAHKDPARPKQAIVVLPQWNADGFSHNSLCAIFNRMGVSALRLSKPYHDIRRPSGAGALRLRRQRQHRAHHLRLPPGGGRHPLLPRLA